MHFICSAGHGGTPVISATPEAEAGGSLELRSSGLQCSMPIGCLHYVQHRHGDRPGAGDHQVA